ALADGVLTHNISARFPAEYEALRENYNSAVDSLRTAISEVKSSAESIRSGADEINEASESLSHRTETQAATLEETAAALDELVTSVKSAADSARQVDDTVKAANAMTEPNAGLMKNAVTAMSEIEKSSEQIGEIISVIDDIAFQTNLLALNAGVEAARAGTAGKGFAVVASEVRALAQRSSGAAQQIKSLISGSSLQVKTGAQLVEQAGAAMLEVVDRVQYISGLVSDIAHGASEQSLGINEINIGVTSLDQVTQQNAAMVEESSSAAMVLSSDSQRLIQLVARFQLSGMQGVVSSTSMGLDNGSSYRAA
ncbi:MAG: methyl-accepting chemotaxis protein, partial [Rhodobacterales bacterium]